MEVTADWPGRVAEIHVAPGARVAAGDELITLESMKMLTPVTTPERGVVAAVLVQVDQFVEEGSVLVRLEL